MPCLVSPPGISRYLPLMNYIPLSFTDITLWQNMPFCAESGPEEERYGSPVGGPLYLPSAALVPTPLPLSGGTVLPEWP